MPEAQARWAIIVHGGAHGVPPEKASANRAGCLAALSAGRRVLEAGGTAVEAVESAVRVLEDDPTFNAGFGSVPNTEGGVEMDAAIMDGATLDVGAVAGIGGVRNPVSVAKLLLREQAILLAGPGAGRFARERSVELSDPNDLISRGPAEAPEEHDPVDTVGCVALDLSGHLAAATSTGGLSQQRPGRVGDSPLPGCGFYADDAVGAVALTGDGEAIARMMTAARIMHRLPHEAPDAALQSALEEVRARLGGEAGAIALLPDGRVSWWHTSPNLPVAYQVSGLPGPQVYLDKTEEEQHAEA